jgi:hypothetical protein
MRANAWPSCKEDEDKQLRYNSVDKRALAVSLRGRCTARFVMVLRRRREHARERGRGAGLR